METNDLFFCYDPKLMKYLRYEKQINFITKARHCVTNKMFYLFHLNEQLNNAIKEFNNCPKKGQMNFKVSKKGTN